MPAASAARAVAADRSWVPPRQHGVRSLAQEVFAFGVDKAIVVEEPRRACYLLAPFTRVLPQFISRTRPEIMLFGATTSGRELAPCLASRVRAGVPEDCTQLSVGDYFGKRREAIWNACLLAIRPTYGGSRCADYGLAAEYRELVPILIGRVRNGFTFGICRRKAEIGRGGWEPACVSH